MTLEEIFDRSTPEPNTGCWLWCGSRNAAGYARLKRRGRTHYIHRMSAELAIGPVGNMFVCHRCDTPSCVNPKHLFIGTPLDNMRDMIAKGRKVSPSGDDSPSRRTPECLRRGEHHHNRKLTWESVTEIRRRASSGETCHALGAEFGVRHQTISDVVRFVTWTMPDKREHADMAAQAVSGMQQRPLFGGVW